MNFFRKGLKTLEEVDPQLILISKNQHIDYVLGGLDDGQSGDSETINSYEDDHDDGELSFDYKRNKQGFDNDCTSWISMEVRFLPGKYRSSCILSGRLAKTLNNLNAH